MSATQPETTAVVRLPTLETESHVQTVVGKPSPVSSDLEEFRGIPYGTVDGRWEHSQLRRRLPNDLFDATKNGPKCTQPPGPNNSRTFQSYLPFPDDEESELECLNLFIIRPSEAALKRHGIDAATAKLPVLVWIHGGGLAFGAATDPMWDPTRLVLNALERGTPIIAVSINYRLSIFGFAASTDLLKSQDGAPVRGLNFGLRDQKVGLTWISRNIAAFGGDADSITIGGQSAGAVSVHCHVMEAERSSSKPLFKKAAMQSGALETLGPTPIEELDKGWAGLCKHFKISADASESDKVQHLRNIPAADLLDAVGKLGLGVFPTASDGITINEGTTAGGDRKFDFGPVDDRDASTKSDATHINVMMGVTDCEAGSFMLPKPLSWDQTESAFNAGYKDSALRSEVMHAYNLAETTAPEDLHKGLVSFINDRVFEVPVHLGRASLRSLRRADGQPESKTVYAFHEAFGNPFPGPDEGVAHHCVGLIYLFEAFQDALVLADQGIRQGYQEPGQADSEQPTPPKPAQEPSYKATNMELCRTLQQYWLEFMFLDELKDVNGLDEITVFGRDRQMMVESLVDTPAWQSRCKRWDVAAKDLDAMSQTQNTLRQLSR